MGFKEYVLRKTIYAIITIIAIIILNYFIFLVLPGNPVHLLVQMTAGYKVNPEQLEYLKKLYGIDQPPLQRFINYFLHAIRFDFGYDLLFEQKPVINVILERLPNTILLLGTATIITIILGISLGVKAASRPGTKFDSAVVFSGLIGYSFASWWIGMVLLYFLGYMLRLFPLRGTVSPDIPPGDVVAYIKDLLWHMALPVTSLVIVSFGGYALVVRNILVDILTEDFIITARAKGLPERIVLFRHALKAAAPPIITMVALSFAFIFTGAILTESVFAWEGMGTLIWQSIQYRNYPVLSGVFTIVAYLVVLAFYIADFLYGVLDPRIRVGR